MLYLIYWEAEATNTPQRSESLLSTHHRQKKHTKMAFRIASLLYFWWGLVSNGVCLVASVRMQPRLAHPPDPLRYENESHNEVLFYYSYYATENETNSTDVPTGSNSTMAPTASPDNSTETMAPTPFNSTNHTLTPTAAPTSGSNRNSTEAPATTAAPQPPPAPPAPVNPPDTTPTSAPSAADKNHKPEHPHVSFLRIIGKGIAWMILLFLGTLAFGGFMQHRYRIYYFARGCYYTVLRLGCTQWILSKLRFNRGGGGGGGFVDNSLNTIIFDNEMTEGLLMQENND